MDIHVMDTLKREVVASMVKVSPPTGVSMALFVGAHIDDWIKVATLTYIVVQVTALIVTKWLQWTGRLGGKEE
jgi:hypothetical protein